MAFINNPLGAAGYSPTVLPDMTAGIQALQRQEIQNELETIKQNKAWERDNKLRNQKLALEFADTGTFDSLRQSQIEAFVNRRNEYEKKAASFFGSGIPSTSPEYTKGLVELQREKQALINETMKEKAFSDAYSDLQGKFPAQYKSLETQEQKDQFNKQIADFVLKMKDPKQKVEVYDMIQAFTPPEPPFAYLLTKRTEDLRKLVGDPQKYVEQGTTDVDVNKLKAALSTNMSADDFLFNQGIGKNAWQSKEEMIDVMANRIAPLIKTDVTPWQPRSTGAGGGSGLDKNARDYTPSPYEYGKNKYNMVQIPSDVSQVDRNFFINKATNLDTGETVQLDQNKASLLGVDVDKGVVILKGAGGFATKNGKPLFIKEGTEPMKTDGEYSGDTMAALSNPSRQESLLKDAYTGGRPVEEVKGISMEETEDGLVIKGTVVVDKKLPFTGSSEVPVEVRYTKFKDPKAEAVFEAPLNENKPAVAIMFPKVKVRGIPLEQYVDKGAQQQSSVPSFTREYLKSQGYSDAKIDQAVKENKIKLK
jgi:hypothetical protein